MNDDFEVISEITDIETIAINKSIREVKQLRKMFGRGRWRKRTGSASLQLLGFGFCHFQANRFFHIT